MLYDGQYTFINQKKWIKIDLPEVLLIRGVKAFSAKVQLYIQNRDQGAGILSACVLTLSLDFGAI